MVYSIGIGLAGGAAVVAYSLQRKTTTACTAIATGAFAKPAGYAEKPGESALLFQQP